MSGINHPLPQMVLTEFGARGETRTQDTGFAIRRLGRLATRANWNGRRDSNSRIEFGRLACFQLHHFRVFGVRRLVGALAIGVRIRIQFRKVIQSGDKSPYSKMELLDGLEPATST